MTKISEYKESSAQFSIVFGGDNQVDAETLLKSLESFLQMTKEVTASVDPEAYAKIMVRPPKSGSVEIVLSMIVANAPTLFTKSNYDNAKFVYGVVKDMLKIKKHISGETPKSISYEANQVANVINSSGESIVVSKASAEQYFTNAKFDNCVVNIFSNLKDTKTFSIGSDDETVSFKNDDFVGMKKSIGDKIKLMAVQATEEDLTQTIDVVLLIRKPDLTGSSKWGFVFNNNIEAEIQDKAFLEAVHSGEIKFRSGSKISCSMEIRLTVDKDKNPTDTKYCVIKVRDVL